VPKLVLDTLGKHRDLIELTVDWHLPEFDAKGNRRVWLDARKEESRRLTGVPCAWVALLDGVPVGSVSLVASNMSTRPDLTPWLAALYVLPDHRGRGVGTALTRRCESEAAIAGYRRLYLYTSRARGYYQRLGWLPIGEDEYEGEGVTVMMREVSLAAQGDPLAL
jgi:predicted N-acetyltransferase YhbS